MIFKEVPVGRVFIVVNATITRAYTRIEPVQLYDDDTLTGHLHNAKDSKGKALWVDDSVRVDYAPVPVIS